ncbi:MAG: M48 family metallopeptidase [Acholeplasmataceae bacterium]|nr:M48 family metallopeptidase [Acholeplasmataceae bacterium]
MNFLILAIILVMFAFEVTVQVLNYKHRNEPLPENVKGLYDEDKYQSWLEYTMANFKFGLLNHTVTTVVLLVLLAFGFFGALEGFTKGLSDSGLLQTLFFMGGFFIIQFVIGLPFSYYHVFVIEERFGFNKTTKKLFITDQVKQIVLTIVFGGGLVALIYSLYRGLSSQIWTFILGAYGAIVVIMLAIFLLNGVIVRWFNKLTPLEEGSLKEKIDTLGEKLGFSVKKIYTMDASKRSTKLNAFFSGLGKTREVVLYDTLIQKTSEEQIIAVLAHELGHATHKDTLKLLITQILIIGVYVMLLGLILSQSVLHTSFGLDGIHVGFGLILMTVLLEPISVPIGFLTNWLSRIYEYKADAFAAHETSKEAMEGALKVLAVENFSNLTPHPLYVALKYNHPTISERLGAIEAL